MPKSLVKIGSFDINDCSLLCAVFISVLVITSLEMLYPNIFDKTAHFISFTAYAFEEKSNYLTYSKNGLGLNYPANWSINNTKNGVLFILPSGNDGSTEPAKVELKIYASNCVPINLLEDRELNTLSDKYGEKNGTLGMATTLVSGLQAGIIDYGAEGLMWHEVVITNSIYAYYIKYSSDPKHFYANLPVVNKMINSIKIARPNFSSPTNLKTYDTYENTTFGIKLNYPSTWNRTNTPFSMNHRGVVISGFVSPCQGPARGLSDDVVITVVPLIYANKNIEHYYNESAKYYQERLFNYFTTLKENKSISIGVQNISAYQLEFNAGNLEMPGFSSIEIGTIVGNNLYMISYNAKSETFLKSYPEFKRMLSSMEFNPVILNASISQSMDKGKFFAKYENPYQGFEIGYPQKWIRDENTDNGNIVSFASPQIRKPGILEISVEKLQSEKISLKRYVENTLASHEAMLNFRLWHIIPTTIGGLNATELVYEHAFDIDRYRPVRNIYRTLEVLVLNNGKGYSLKYTSTAYDFGYQFDTVQSMFDTFILTDYPKKIDIGYTDKLLGLEMTFPNEWSGYLMKSSNSTGVTIFSGGGASSSGRTTNSHAGDKATISLLIENIINSKKIENVTSNSTKNIPCQTRMMDNISKEIIGSIEFEIGCRDGPRNTITKGYLFQKADKVIYLVYSADTEAVFQGHLSEFLNTVAALKIENIEPPSTGIVSNLSTFILDLIRTNYFLLNS